MSSPLTIPMGSPSIPPTVIRNIRRAAARFTNGRSNRECKSQSIRITWSSNRDSHFLIDGSPFDAAARLETSADELPDAREKALRLARDPDEVVLAFDEAVAADAQIGEWPKAGQLA